MRTHFYANLMYRNVFAMLCFTLALTACNRLKERTAEIKIEEARPAFEGIYLLKYLK